MSTAISTPAPSQALVGPVHPPEISVDYRTAVVTLVGELDIANCDRIGPAIALIESGDVVVDLGDVTFVDVAACRAIALAHRSLLQQGRQMLLRGCHASTVELLLLVAPEVLDAPIAL